jgi:uncharacterized protein (DUF2249 family)
MSNQEKKQSEPSVVDVRSLPPPARHNHIERIFNELEPGEEILVVNDYEPVHLVQFMKQQRKDFDTSAYKAYKKGDSEWIAVFRKKSSEDSEVKGEGQDFVFANIEKMRTSDEHSFSPVPVFSAEGYRVIMAYFRAGQFIPVHAPANDVVIFIYRGEGEVVASSSRFRVRQEDMVVVRGGNKRGIKAESDMQILHITVPPPNKRDHERVSEMIERGIFEG